MVTIQRPGGTEQKKRISGLKGFTFNPDFAVDEDLKVQQNIKVAVRIRPLSTVSESSPNNDNEKSKEKTAWALEKSGAMDTLVQKGMTLKVDGKSVFRFDSVFDEETQTPLVYKSMARGMVKTVLAGKHATLFAYGQTGSGKTFTMQGDGKRSGGQAGIIQLVTSDLFRFMKQGKSTDREFVVKVSYIEIYNETIRDLLSDDAGSTQSHGSAPPPKRGRRGSHLDRVNIRATASGEVVINSIQNEVKSADEVLEYLIAGNAQRKVAKTDMNKHSSRSHAVFRLTVESRPKEPGEGGVEEIVRISDFNLVDLAGSESVKMSGTTGIRKREGANINQSLLSLSTVIHSLSMPEKKRPKHINYRDSKLTRMLQPHLSGNAEIAIVCCISPSKAYAEETRTTLRFAYRAKLIRVTPKVNEILDDGAKIKKLERELAKAKKMIEELRGQPSSPLGFSSSQASEPLQNGSADKIRSASINTLQSGSVDDSLQTESVNTLPSRSRSGSHDSDENSHALSVADYGYDEMAQTRNYVMPGQSPIPVPPESSDGNENNSQLKEYTMPLKSSYDSDDESQYEELLPRDDFKLDAVGEVEARKCVQKFMKGKDYGDSSTEGDVMFDASWDEDSQDSLPYLDVGVKKESTNATTRTDDESSSYDGPPASYKDASFKFGTKLSRPDTLGVDTIPENESKYGTHDGQDGRTNEISWDTMGLDANRPEHVGQPLRALKSLAEQDLPIPKEVTIICASSVDEEPGLKEKNEDAVKQVAFLKAKLEGADDIIESVFKDLERARLCIHDMVHRNVQLVGKLNDKRRQDVKEEYEEGEINVEQYWLLKGSMYVGLFFFFTGGYELFMASVIFIWLMLEANLS
ncbi:unnamed protein product [Cylindrotheca closterium]|uniref:Kinesin motor domain-containing protein n=1 Tax=Cylindrotheca closterium TaxID=2856 RepID=A0AAD2GBT7_9STRA|nr:unnamed protein product [Cylindrotheca closterium]